MTDASTMLKLIKDFMLTLGLPFSGIRSQGYDRASNMSGRENGLQAKVLTENPKAFYLYYFGHQLNLVVQNSLKAIPEVAIALGGMYAVAQFIKNSPNKWDRFNSIVNFISADDLSSPKDNHMPRPICTTRWVMRLTAVDTSLDHYHEILECLESIKDDYAEPANNREKADSFLRNHETFKTTSTTE
ncbi:Zinc finger MYM-type protein 1-like [Oopsacas minuta]|uniref:Zinc finger MYM-type protein 1-like n=1 Tax=Oopsacas minuta TaxID=111878 RepID=A0AAV7K5Z1_9METZ|nr:Zinc finger MYM-type protein 1-like [Oopsacas minuta]